MVIPVEYRKEKTRRNFKFKEELNDFERNLKRLVTAQENANYLLIIIAMILFGLFVFFIMGALA